MKDIKFRPHHFLCTLGFEGKGYSDSFVQNFKTIADRLRRSKDGDNTIIQITQSTDSICAPCPNKIDTQCQTEDKIRTLDQAHSKILKLDQEKSITWKEAKKRIAQNISEKDFNNICAPCSWRSLGVCLSALKNLKNEPKTISILIACFLFSTTLYAGKKQESRSVEDLPVSQLVELSTKIKDAKTDAESRLIEVILKNPNRLDIHRLIDEFASSPWIAETPLWLTAIEAKEALLQFKKKSTQLALRKSEKAFSRTPSFTYIPHELIQKYIATCFQIKSDEKCRSWIFRIIQSYPKASKEISWINSTFGDHYAPSSVLINQKWTQKYPSQDLDIKQFELGLKSYLNQNMSDAIDQWETLLKDYPKTTLKYRTLFWLHKAKKNQSKDYQALSAETPLSYYGLIAALEAGSTPSKYIETEVPLAKKREPLLHPDDQAYLERAENLISLKKFRLASKLLEAVKAKDIYSNEFLFYLAALQNKSGAYSSSFATLNELFSRRAPRVTSTTVERIIFPTPFLTIYKDAAKLNDLDFVLILSLSKQESGFNDDALSGSGAAGLMQLMPFTAVDVEPEIFRDELTQPSKNVQIGAKYLKSLIQKYKGNIALALASYNAGPTAVDRWIKEGKSQQGLLLFIEQIPYKETREYVASIIRNYWWYQLRINGESNFDVLGYFWKN